MKIKQLIDEQMKEFDEKFVSFQPDGTSWGAGLYLNGKVMPNEIKSFISSSTRKCIEAVGNEIIGIDDENTHDVFSDPDQIMQRNELREEQRIKLKEILSNII